MFWIILYIPLYYNASSFQNFIVNYYELKEPGSAWAFTNWWGRQEKKVGSFMEKTGRFV